MIFFAGNNVIDVVFAAACDKGLFFRRNGFDERKTGNALFCFPCRKGRSEAIDLAEGALKAVSLHLLLMLCDLPAEKAGFAGGGGYLTVLLQFRAEKGGLVEMIVGIAVIAGDRDGDRCFRPASHMGRGRAHPRGRSHAPTAPGPKATNTPSTFTT